jgi:RimJ/RimL family protein N-acetyltransferase
VQLATERLVLRGWLENDAEPFARINAHPSVARYLRGRPETSEETEALMASIAEHWIKWHYGLWAVERCSDARFIGFVGFSHHRLYPDQVEIGWRIDPACWGLGLATEGAKAALDHGMGTHGFERVISVIHRDNAASKRVAAKIGMRPWQEAELPHPDWPAPLPIVVYATASQVSSGGWPSRGSL